MPTVNMATTTDEPSHRPKYPIGIPAKFSAGGVVQRYPGNTTLCHVPPNSPLLPVLQAFYTALASHPTLAPSVHLLPPASWHMTIFDGMRESECEPGMWPLDVEKLPLSESTVIYRQKLAQFGLKLKGEGLAPPYQMRVRGIDGRTAGVGLELEGTTPREDARMRRLRDRISDVLGFRAPNHLTYTFHLSVAYFLRHIDGVDRDELEAVFAHFLPQFQQHILRLGAVEFCTFENMHAFPRLMYLGDEE